MRILFFGHKGWIASYFLPLLQQNNHQVIYASGRADDSKNVDELLSIHKPDHVVSFIGRTHGDNINTIDYLEQPGKLVENIRDNLYAPVILALACKKHNVHFTYLGTGCIFSDIDPTSNIYTESDDPNFFGSSYSIVKGYTDRIMKNFDNVLNVRIRMPITPDKSSRNFITKITTYENICSIPNSMTVLPTLLPVLMDMMEKNRTGTINLVNPGLISHNEILEMYKSIINPDKKWKNFSIDEQDKILSSKRSNNQLDTSLLTTWYPNVPNIKDSVLLCLMKMRDE